MAIIAFGRPFSTTIRIGFSEQIDPSTGAFMGNFPQEFSHIGVIANGVNLARVKADPQ
ncbi:hypothetical protein ACWCPQ_06170 [Nocardia sp. NPDC001965]